MIFCLICKTMRAGFGWTNCPSRIRMFLRLVEIQASLTWPYHQRGSWLEPNVCVLCKKDEEPTNHILLNYGFIAHIWRKCADALGIDIHNGTCADIWKKFKNNPLGRTLVVAIRWNIWRERNNITFYNTAHFLDTCMRLIIYGTLLWIDILSDEEQI